MKFKSLEMSNFMRYKGINRMEFSCDEEKNVTVILGDNTVGKTTIAQAFWRYKSICIFLKVVKIVK